MIRIAIIFAVLLVSVATAQAQTVNFYDARGNRTGSATTTGSGTTNYYERARQSHRKRNPERDEHELL